MQEFSGVTLNEKVAEIVTFLRMTGFARKAVEVLDASAKSSGELKQYFGANMHQFLNYVERAWDDDSFYTLVGVLAQASIPTSDLDKVADFVMRDGPLPAGTAWTWAALVKTAIRKRVIDIIHTTKQTCYELAEPTLRDELDPEIVIVFPDPPRADAKLRV